MKHRPTTSGLTWRRTLLARGEPRSVGDVREALRSRSLFRSASIARRKYVAAMSVIKRRGPSSFIASASAWASAASMYQ